MSTPETPVDDVVFVLFDGDYHLGFGALVNSLFNAGFAGMIYAGYRDRLPAWATSARAVPPYHEYDLGAGCVIRFVKIEFEGHLTNYKPAFMLSILRRDASGARRIFYFDVDIVVKAPWQFFQEWVSCGIAVCADVNEPRMLATHPLRQHWRRIAGELGFECRPLEGYFNAGFLGLTADRVELLEIWQALIAQIERSGVPLAQLAHGTRPSPVAFPDQDMLNVAFMATEFPVSALDGASMDFTPGGYVMSHAVSRAKPWRRRYFIDALSGYRPDMAHKLYWRNVRAPIPVMSRRRRIVARFSLGIASAIGRFYGRH